MNTYYREQNIFSNPVFEVYYNNRGNPKQLYGFARLIGAMKSQLDLMAENGMVIGW